MSVIFQTISNHDTELYYRIDRSYTQSGVVEGRALNLIIWLLSSELAALFGTHLRCVRTPGKCLGELKEAIGHLYRYPSRQEHIKPDNETLLFLCYYSILINTHLDELLVIKPEKYIHIYTNIALHHCNTNTFQPFNDSAVFKTPNFGKRIA